MSVVSQNLRILLVEDDKTMRQIEIHTLRKIGYTNIVQAADGDEAVGLLEKGEVVDVIISDWNMPKKGGFELLIWIRANKDYSDIPFIMATGQADKKHEQKAVEAGVTGFVIKPFSDNELKDALNRAFGIDTQEFENLETLPKIGKSGKPLIKIAHIQITDHLVMGVLKYLLDKGDLKANHFELELICMDGWNPVAKALEIGLLDGACILAPLAMDLYSFGVPIKLVLLTHKNGSIFVRTSNKIYQPPFAHFFQNSSFLIPHKMSVHHILSHLFLSKIGLNPSMSKGEKYNVEFEVVQPVNMPEFLKNNPKHAGFMVAEPIGSQSVEAGAAVRQFISGELWENHPCCGFVVQNDFIKNYTDALFELTKLIVKAGKFIAANPDAAAEIAVSFLDPDKKLGLTEPVLKNVLTEKGAITTDDLYPVMEDLNTMQNYMVKDMGIGQAVNIKDFVDLRFADRACDTGPSTYKPSMLHSSKEEILNILNKSFSGVINPTASLSRGMNEHKEDESDLTDAQEGKYLTFFLDSEEYGISIKNIREIIGMMPITHVPRTPMYVKGVINLRGRVIPVMDLRIKFNMEYAEYSDRTCILVVEIPSADNHHNVHIGVVVDSVSEVLNIKADDIEKNPKFSSSIDMSAVIGIAAVGNKVKILLDIAKVLS